MKIAYVFFNGELLGDKKYYLDFFRKYPGDFYCADGGANHMDSLGIYPKEIWGDLDSVSEEILKKYREKDVIIKQFSRDKDFTDGELILRYVSEKSYDKIIVIGGLGGRKDHELSNINLLFLFDNLSFLSEEEELFSIKNSLKLTNIKGKTVSFIPFSQEVTNLTLKGFKFPLDNYLLKQGSSICMSNIVIEDECEVNFQSGRLVGVIVK